MLTLAPQPEHGFELRGPRLAFCHHDIAHSPHQGHLSALGVGSGADGSLSGLWYGFAIPPFYYEWRLLEKAVLAVGGRSSL